MGWREMNVLYHFKPIKITNFLSNIRKLNKKFWYSKSYKKI